MSDNNFYQGNDNVCPVGSIIYWAGKTALKETLANFVPADGRALNKADYPLLFQLLGTRYGTTDTTFNIPNPTGQLIIGGTDTSAGVIVPPTRNGFATATFSIKDQSYLPPFAMDYDTTAKYAGTNKYYKDGIGNENLYTKSSTGHRDGGGDKKFCRDDIPYITDGGIGKQETNPQITFDSGSDPDPIDVTSEITAPTSYEAPTFNIIAMIKVKN
jgi:microcystin-dependent protein